VSCIINTPGGPQTVTFLTESGLYKILFRSRKPIAKIFQRWICQVIKEIRLYGEYNLKEQIKLKNKEIEDIHMSKEKTFLTNFSRKNIVYIGYAEEGILKFGWTDDIETRISDHKKTYRPDFTFEYIYESIYNSDIEKRLKQILKNNIITKKYANKNRKELIQLSNTFTIHDVDKIIREIKDEVELGEQDRNKNAEIEILRRTNAESVLTINELTQRLKIHNISQYSLPVPEIIKEKDTKITTLQNTINNMKKEQYIARNISSGEERFFKAYADAHEIAKIGPHSIKDNYIDKPNQCRGWTFRTENNPYWEPPKNFIYDKDQKSSTHMTICKSVHRETGEEIYYNSITEAAAYMHSLDPINFPNSDTNRRSITHVIQGGKTLKIPLKNYIWSKVDNCGSWVYPDGTKVLV
jgi:predicted GIY-YIG superfamily endonuclease